MGGFGRPPNPPARDPSAKPPDRASASRSRALRIVLASASPRRRELLQRLIGGFEVIPSALDERLEPGPFTETIARLAELKARAVAASQPSRVILAADTMVILDGEALGKPADAAAAVAMLQRLRGREHEVMTGVAVLDGRTARVWTGTEESRVVMARYPDAVIERYVDSGAPLDKAGGYAVQDFDGALVDAVVGSYTNVIGLPLGLTVRLLTSTGVRLSGWSSA
ncbi:MAG TPA: Maf family protein [Methylomirabilota bacterium]|nr:Maf family protein [Methylomirabilota bacterium]